MNPKKINIGVIGVGHLGSLHSKMYDEIETANFVGVFDVNEEKRNEVASKYRVKAFASMDELLRVVDAVSIATVTMTHFEVAKHVLMAGKHVLIEKPITSTLAEADELIAIAKQKNVLIQIIENCIFGEVCSFAPMLSSHPVPGKAA